MTKLRAELSALHYDLFEGGPHAPRVRKPVAKKKKKPARMTLASIFEAPAKKIAPPAHVSKIGCPCCGQTVVAPTLDIIVDHYGLTPVEARILGAIWKGKGMAVMSERIFDAIYIDDPDGGPEPSRMYVALKVGLCHIRAKLKGSGVSIQTVGYRRGFRLHIRR